MDSANPHDTGGVSRRRALGMAGLGAVALGGAGALGYAGRATAGEDTPPPRPDGLDAPRGLPVAFHGPHQAGIATPVQDRLHFTAFDVHDRGPDEAHPAAQGLDPGRRADVRRP